MTDMHRINRFSSPTFSARFSGFPATPQASSPGRLLPTAASRCGICSSLVEIMHSGAESSCPRITADMMQNFVGRKVRFVGKLEDQNNGKVTLADHDDSRVIVESNPGNRVETTFVEVLGTVKAPGVIVESARDEFGETFDIKMSAEAIKLGHSTFDYLFTK